MDEKSEEDRQMGRMLFQLAKVVKRICEDKTRPFPFTNISIFNII